MSDKTTMLPCPFCGSKTKTEQVECIHHGTVYRIGCNTEGCRGWYYGSVLYRTEAKAIAAWNTRAYGTCEMIPLCSWLFECSKCGEKHHEDDLRKYNYCPNCGAKVVKQ